MVFIKTLKPLKAWFLLSSVALLLLFISACSWNDASSKKPSSRTQSSSKVNTPKRQTRQPSGKRPAYHVVGSGEGFYTIARKYGLDFKKLAAWNNMSTNDVIFKGMKIKLYPPKNTSPSSSNTTNGVSTSSSASTLNLQWPLRGRIINKFNANDNTVKGIDIAGQAGQRIKASASGKVVYAGSGLVGLGNVIVIKHNETYLTAYGYNEKLLFSEGASVKQGQDIAIIGIGLDNQRMLHFEVRKNGKPVNPIGYLPK